MAPKSSLPASLLIALTLLAVGPASALASGDVTVSIGGAGTVTSDPAGFNCTKTAHATKTGTCKLHYVNTQPGNEPRDVTLTANDTSGSGYQFDHWLGACTGGARNCTVTVDSDKSATAVFEDVQPPSISFTAPPGGSGFVRGTTTFAATASDNDDIAQVVFRRHASEVLATDNTAPYTTAFDTTALSDGLESFQASAYDDHGNVSEAGFIVTVDNTAPAVTVGSGPSGQAFPQGSTQAWSFSASDGAGSGVQSVQCSVVAAAAPDDFQQCSGGASAHSVSNLAAGSYRFAVRATDVIGNPASVPQSRTFTVTAPGGAPGASRPPSPRSPR